jgi:negative regulator of replication initiation
MTKSHEKGDNEYTRAAKREAMRTGQSVADILRRMLSEARQKRDSEQINKIVQAQKFALERNTRKRRGRRK